MKNLNAYATECIRKLNAIGIYPNYITNWQVNSRAKSRWGQCSRSVRYGKVTYTIQISSVLLTDSAPEKGLEETILHELLHAVDGCMNHGANWKMLADRVNATYGYNVQRTDSYQSKGFTSDPLQSSESYKYRITCACCHREWKYMRNSKVVQACRSNSAKCPCGASKFVVINL